MPDHVIRKHATNVYAYKLFLLSKLFRCSFDLGTIKPLLLSNSARRQKSAAAGMSAALSIGSTLRLSLFSRVTLKKLYKCHQDVFDAGLSHLQKGWLRN